MRLFLKPEEYLTVDRDEPWPDGDYLLCPGAFWYKEKMKPYAERANQFPGKRVLIDFGRMFEKPRKNLGGIKADFIASAFDEIAVDASHFARSLPSLDPCVSKGRTRGVTVVTSRDDPANPALLRCIEANQVVWKVRNKYGQFAKEIKDSLRSIDEFIYREDKDYNDAEPVLDHWFSIACIHVNVKRVSWSNYEAARAGVPTFVWDGKLRKKRKLVEFAKMYEGVEQYYCTKNLIRNLRETLDSN